MVELDEIVALEKQIFELTAKAHALRRAYRGEEVPDYPFRTLGGDTSLRQLFGDHDRLLVVHNMGQGCRYCTLWGDGFNGLLPHLESAMAVVVVSPDAPEVQRRFAGSRGWRFRMASHADSPYAAEQTTWEGHANYPGATVYERDGDTIRVKNRCVFGPGDQYCSAFPLLALAGVEEWTPQFRYWSRPGTLLDGGENVVD